MSKLLIIANWKMNPQTLSQAKALFKIVQKGTQGLRDADVVICPPFVQMSELRGQASNVKLGAQNCHWQEVGAFTGEISPVMLKNIGCQYVIIGHSERRQFLKETNEMINQKIKAALKAKLRPIFCLGENENEDLGLVIKEQLTLGLQDINSRQIKEITIAYEPVWAIGTGRACSPDSALEAALLIRKILSQFYNRVTAAKVKILYGGSVDSQNAALYIQEAKMNGLLIGGASLNAPEFIKIVKSVL